MTSDSPNGGGHVRTAVVEYLSPGFVAAVVAGLAWFGWAYLLDPVDGDPSNPKTAVYVVVLAGIVWLAAFLTRALWVGLLGPVRHGTCNRVGCCPGCRRSKRAGTCERGDGCVGRVRSGTVRRCAWRTCTGSWQPPADPAWPGRVRHRCLHCCGTDSHGAGTVKVGTSLLDWDAAAAHVRVRVDVACNQRFPLAWGVDRAKHHVI